MQRVIALLRRPIRLRRLARPTATTWLLLALFALQFALWQGRLAGIQPRLDVVPPAPQRQALLASTFGDAQTAFRWRVLELQAFGDAGGRTTPLQQYDFAELVRWFEALDSLDGQASVVPTMAAFIYGQTPDPAQLRQVVDYLRRRGAANPAREYRWTTHAAMLAAHKLGEPALALDILSDLKQVPESALPRWVQMMPAFVYAQVGERQSAADLLRAILGDGKPLAPSDRQYLEWQIGRLTSPPGAPPAARAQGSRAPSAPSAPSAQ
ncbi:hypothetical protein [Polaromonas sp.]|uniref:hypothetical protein n=1 Tax=Polaromonas sp. TaxID=1869339 RepID=UPI00356A77CB